MKNTFKNNIEPRQIKTFTPVIPDGHPYRPVTRVIPQFEDALIEMRTPFIAFMTSVVKVLDRGIGL